jgi:predicted nucleotidyltransferase
MKAEQIEELRKTLIDMLRKHEVKKAALFGSIVRGEATDESDIDPLVEFEGRKSLLDLAGLKSDLQEIVRTYVKLINRFIRFSKNGY